MNDSSSCCNPPFLLRHRYLLLRHGNSEANVQERIVSDPAVGTARFGLSPAGRIESERAATDLAGAGISRIFSSPFLRARETAAIIADRLGLPTPETHYGLRERAFGTLEGESHRRYEEVWQEDAAGAPSTFGAEECDEVFARMSGALAEIEALIPAGEDSPVILIVSHGDPLQILSAGARGIAPRLHRSLPLLRTAEWVPLGGMDGAARA